MSTHMVERPGRPRRVLTIILWIGAAAVILGVLIPVGLITLQRQALATTRTAHPAPGRLVEVGGYRMHIHCEGESEPGGPTVVIVAGDADFSLDWMPIQDRLAALYRVCVYDRAGYGWSDPRPEPRDADHVVEELHSLLVAADEREAVLLVGHALGGVTTRLYAARYRDDVAGLVLVDAVTDYVQTDVYAAQQRKLLGSYEVTRFMVGSGISRVLTPIAGERALPPAARALPQDLQSAYRGLLLDPAYYETAIAELQLAQTSVEQANAALVGEAPLGDLPLIVLTAAQTSPAGAGPDGAGRVPASAVVIQEQGALTLLSEDSERRMLGRSGHQVHLDEPDAILSAVDDVYANIMTGTRVR
ncbi:MAG: alpha/beta hydrolase [Anaerolineae bacterium]|nr:alpha/beta hydrolase [Anaerolineae bacterium]